VIALTANVYMEHLKEDATVGFDEVLVKPFKERDLYEKIVNVLKPENMTRNGMDFPNGKEIVSDESLFSLKYLEKTSGANREFEIKMLELFIRNNTVHLEALKKGVSDKDWDAIYRIVHKMIPQFRYLEIGKTERKLKLLEELTGEIKDLEKIPALVKEISAETSQILLLLADEVDKLMKKNRHLEEAEDGMIVDHEKTR
jgi:DNA-binding response OmpR family regulator